MIPNEPMRRLDAALGHRLLPGTNGLARLVS
jgi:hypothetical protein